MLALSTSCLAPGPAQLEERIDELLSYEVEAYELSYRIADDEIAAFGRAIREAGRRVVSLHSYCPVPKGIVPKNAGGDLLLLTSEDSTLRERGVKATIDTLEWAARLEADAIVMHSGRTPIDYPKLRIRELYDSGRWPGDSGEGILRKLAKDRAETAERALDLLCLSLDPILEAAGHFEVSVGLENRIYPHEIPAPKEFTRLLEVFAGAKVGTWYDTGHAKYQEVLGFALPGETWDAMRPSLLGLHVHDVEGIQDHLPPGEGSLDLGELVRDLPETMPLVVECRATQGADRIGRGITELRRVVEGDENTPADPFFLG